MAGTLTISTLSDGTNSTSATNLVKAPCVAWVNFNGTGTVAIRTSYNVSSITDNGTGDYTINFTNALTDANYVLSGWARNTGQGFYIVTSSTNTSLTTTSARIQTAFSTTAGDADYVTVGFIR